MVLKYLFRKKGKNPLRGSVPREGAKSLWHMVPIGPT